MLQSGPLQSKLRDPFWLLLGPELQIIRVVYSQLNGCCLDEGKKRQVKGPAPSPSPACIGAGPVFIFLQTGFLCNTKLEQRALQFKIRGAGGEANRQ